MSSIIEDIRKARSSRDLYNFKGEVPPWTSYCRACLRRLGVDPYKTKSCGAEMDCEHYPFKYQYSPSKE